MDSVSLFRQDVCTFIFDFLEFLLAFREFSESYSESVDKLRCCDSFGFSDSVCLRFDVVVCVDPFSDGLSAAIKQ